jgi:hypothetical protein
VSGQAAAANYQEWVYRNQAEDLHKRMRELNQEASERNRLDAEAAKSVKEDNKDAKNG